MFDSSTLPPLRDVISRYDLRAEKKLGQNFLLDGNITDKIVRVAGDLSGHIVFEIGPGPGGLTRSLLKSAAEKVIAVEFDERAVRALAELEGVAQGRLQVIKADALQVDLRESCSADMKCAILANLPYNIATPLLVRWLSDIRHDFPAYNAMVLMFQKEVADRITARPGSKAYGRLSVLTQWLCNTRKAYDLPPSAFTPPPKVKSSIVHFVPKEPDGDAPSFRTVEQLTAAAFGQRRKMIRSSLKVHEEVLDRLYIDKTLRAEDIPPEKYIEIAKSIDQIS